MKSSSREIKKWIVSNDHFTPYVAQKNELKILDWKRTSSVVVLDYASIHQDCRRSFLLKLGYKADQKVWQQTHEKIVFFDIIFFSLNFQLKRLSFTYRILIRRTPSEQSLNPKGNTHTRSHMICLIVVVFSGLMFDRSYQLWNKHGGLRLSAQKSGLRGWVRAGFELSPVSCFVLWQDTI